MNWLKQHKRNVLIPIFLLILLAGAFWYGGGSPGLHGWKTDADVSASTSADRSAATSESEADSQTQAEDQSAASSQCDSDAFSTPETPPQTLEEQPTPQQEPASDTPTSNKPTSDKPVSEKPVSEKPSSDPSAGSNPQSPSQGTFSAPSTGKDQYSTDPVPSGKPTPVEPQDTTVTDAPLTCTISISCAAILKHMDWLAPDKTSLVPADGWILPPTKVTFYEGESVFNVLQRTCKQKKIHMEFKNTPMYNSAYIQGIHNLYEFDCGELSGWMYKVNDWFPNYGCSRYQLKDGDKICWVYTCDLGSDVGGRNVLGGE